MNHAIIERDNVVDRYVLGQLAPAEAEAFEEHYLACPACLDQIELTEKLRQTARQAALLEAAPGPARQGVTGRRYLLAAAALAALALGTAFAWRSVVENGAPTPQVNALVLALAPLRGEGAGAAVHRGDAPAVVLSLELDRAEAPRYRAVLAREGRQLWASDALRPSSLDTLVITLPAELVPPGSYRVEVTALPAAGDAYPVAAFAFSVER